jgi:hypothetical protein
MEVPMGKDVERILEQFAKEVEAAAGSGHCTIVLYGSGASGHHIPGRSDLNLLVIVDEVTISLMTHMQKSIGAWTKGGISTPLLVDRDFLRSSTDSYPLEILGMMSAYRLVRGSDPFEGIKIDPKDVRLQAEREIKAKELLLRRGYVESCGKESRVRAVLSASVPALEAILRGMLFLGGEDWKKSGPAFREACAKSLGVDGTTLNALRDLRGGKSRPNRNAIMDLYARTLRQLATLSGKIEDRGATG